MILSLFILLFSSGAAAVDTAVASAIETMVAARTSAVHEIEFRTVPPELVRLDTRAVVRIVDEPRAAYRGMVSVPVEVTSPAGNRHRYILGITVRTFESVAVAGAMIDRHQEIRTGRIVMQTIETTQMSVGPVTDVSMMAGMRTKQIIAAGNVITGSMIEPLPMIVSGSPVTVSVHKENVSLSVVGTAKKDGWKGSVIPVEVTAIKQHLNAKVVDARHVEVIDK